MNEAIPAEEAFHNGFFYFMAALAILAKDAEAQCEEMGNFNVAWELQHDVSAGEYLANNSLGQLSPEQSNAILALVRLLKDVPTSQLPAGSGREPNLIAMQHPSWLPLRAGATSLLALLRPAAERSRHHQGAC